MSWAFRLARKSPFRYCLVLRYQLSQATISNGWVNTGTISAELFPPFFHLSSIFSIIGSFNYFYSTILLHPVMYLVQLRLISIQQVQPWPIHHLRPITFYYPGQKKRPLRLCIKSKHCSYHGILKNQAWLLFGVQRCAKSRPAAPPCQSPDHADHEWYRVIRTVFWFYA